MSQGTKSGLLRAAGTRPFTALLPILALTGCLLAAAPLAAAPRDRAAEEVRAMLELVNAGLAESGAGIRAEAVSYLSLDAPASGGNQTVYISDHGNRRLRMRYVPGDPRRGGRTDVTWIVDQVEAGGSSAAPLINAAIDGAMASWDSIPCASIPLRRLPNLPGVDLGVIEFLIGRRGRPVPEADVTFAGFQARLFPEPILAATFFFVFIEEGGFTNPAGTPTDVDADGYADMAFTEILYGLDWFGVRIPWAVDGDPLAVDFETVMLHEAGHAMGQDHFGIVRENPSGLHISPDAVMNAVVVDGEVVREPLTTDVAAHCEIWAGWPVR